MSLLGHTQTYIHTNKHPHSKHADNRICVTVASLSRCKRTSLTLFAMKNFVIARTHHTPTLGVVAVTVGLLLLLCCWNCYCCCCSVVAAVVAVVVAISSSICERSARTSSILYHGKKRNWPEHTVTSSFFVCAGVVVVAIVYFNIVNFQFNEETKIKLRKEKFPFFDVWRRKN